jgi:hypothetical protein
LSCVIGTPILATRDVRFQQGLQRRLQAWLGHSTYSTINMTMRSVHHVEEDYRPIPEHIVSAGCPFRQISLAQDGFQMQRHVLWRGVEELRDLRLAQQERFSSAGTPA